MFNKQSDKKYELTVGLLDSMSIFDLKRVIIVKKMWQ